jgi:hypothetical protein
MSTTNLELVVAIALVANEAGRSLLDDLGPGDWLELGHVCYHNTTHNTNNNLPISEPTPKQCTEQSTNRSRKRATNTAKRFTTTTGLEERRGRDGCRCLMLDRRCTMVDGVPV